MRLALPFLILFIVALDCDQSRNSNTNGPAANSQSPAAAATSSPTPAHDNDPVARARALVGLDDGGKMLAAEDDIRVKRVRYLLEELTRLTGEETYSIASMTDNASDTIENKYGKKVTRQKLLEDMKEFYSDTRIKQKPSYADAITAQMILQYAN